MITHNYVGTTKKSLLNYHIILRSTQVRLYAMCKDIFDNYANKYVHNAPKFSMYPHNSPWGGAQKGHIQLCTKPQNSPKNNTEFLVF
jgi:hypothetical protein